MAIDAYYFSHDSNANDDPKCVLLIEQLGLEGYGIYWVLIELLRDQPGYRYPLALIPAISRRYNTTNEKMKTVITNYRLFEIEDEEFFSLSLMKRMEHLDSKRKQASFAGKKSAEARLLNASSTDVQQTFNDRSTIKVNKTKLNETKVKKIKTEVVKKLFGEKVHLSDQEHRKLIEGNGEQDTNEMISILDNWYCSKGKPANKSDYHTMVKNGWVFRELSDRKQKQGGQVRNQKQPNRPKGFDAIDEWYDMTKGMLDE